MLDPHIKSNDKDKKELRAVLGLPIPWDSLSLVGGKVHTFLGTWTVLVFYPGDFTPVCTRQWCQYRDFGKWDAVIIGVTSGVGKRHDDFRRAYRLPFAFVDDEKGEIAKGFAMKGMRGYVKRGIAIVDTNKILRYCKGYTVGLRYPKAPDIASKLKELKIRFNG